METEVTVQGFSKEIFMRQVQLMDRAALVLTCDCLYSEIIELRRQKEELTIAHLLPSTGAIAAPSPTVNQPSRNSVDYVYSPGDKVSLNGIAGTIVTLLSPQNGVPFYRVKAAATSVIVSENEIESGDSDE